MQLRVIPNGNVVLEEQIPKPNVHFLLKVYLVVFSCREEVARALLIFNCPQAPSLPLANRHA